MLSLGSDCPAALHNGKIELDGAIIGMQFGRVRQNDVGGMEAFGTPFCIGQVDEMACFFRVPINESASHRGHHFPFLQAW